jgi:hypothetical protein
MFTSDEDHSEILKKASYTAYNEAIRVAFMTLSNSITEYFAEHHDRYDNEILVVPPNFRPLKDYERTLKIQNLTLRLVLRTAEQSDHNVAIGAGLPVRMNGRGAST